MFSIQFSARVSHHQDDSKDSLKKSLDEAAREWDDLKKDLNLN